MKYGNGTCHTYIFTTNTLHLQFSISLPESRSYDPVSGVVRFQRGKNVQENVIEKICSGPKTSHPSIQHVQLYQVLCQIWKPPKNHKIQLLWPGDSYGLNGFEWSLPFMVQTFPEHQPIHESMTLRISIGATAGFGNNMKQSYFGTSPLKPNNLPSNRGLFTSAQGQHDLLVTSYATYGYLDDRDLAPFDEGCAPFATPWELSVSP